MPFIVPMNHFVDPLNGTDDTAPGRGLSINDPFRSNQWALDHVTRDTDVGNKSNTMSSADDVLTKPLDWTTFGSPGYNAPFIFAGYDTVVGDFGIGRLDGNGGSVMSSGQYIECQDMKLFGSGASSILSGSPNYSQFIRCHFSGTTAKAANTLTNAYFNQCSFTNITADYCIYNCGVVTDCWFDVRGTAIYYTSSGTIKVARNIFNLSGIDRGVYIYASSGFEVAFNSVLAADGSTGSGILLGSPRGGAIINNLIEGLNGVAGDGIQVTAYGHPAIRANSMHNVATPVIPNTAGIFENDTEILGESLFKKEGANTYENRYKYFAPADVGNIIGGGIPYGSGTTRGAVQAPAGGGSPTSPSSVYVSG